MDTKRFDNGARNLIRRSRYISDDRARRLFESIQLALQERRIEEMVVARSQPFRNQLRRTPQINQANAFRTDPQAITVCPFECRAGEDGVFVIAQATVD